MSFFCLITVVRGQQWRQWEWTTLHEVYDMILQQDNATTAPLQSYFIKRLSYDV
jgi:hypothetical protein